MVSSRLPLNDVELASLKVRSLHEVFWLTRSSFQASNRKGEPNVAWGSRLLPQFAKQIPRTWGLRWGRLQFPELTLYLVQALLDFRFQFYELSRLSQYFWFFYELEELVQVIKVLYFVCYFQSSFAAQVISSNIVFLQRE